MRRSLWSPPVYSFGSRFCKLDRWGGWSGGLSPLWKLSGKVESLPDFSKEIREIREHFRFVDSADSQFWFLVSLTTRHKWRWSQRWWCRATWECIVGELKEEFYIIPLNRSKFFLRFATISLSPNPKNSKVATRNVLKKKYPKQKPPVSSLMHPQQLLTRTISSFPLKVFLEV